jgi:hypothetical protein
MGVWLSGFGRREKFVSSSFVLGSDDLNMPKHVEIVRAEGWFADQPEREVEQHGPVSKRHRELTPVLALLVDAHGSPNTIQALNENAEKRAVVGGRYHSRPPQIIEY